MINKTKFSLDIDDNEERNKNIIDRKALKAFADGAISHNTENLQKILEEQKYNDPNALPTINFRLRLNHYEVNLIKQVSKNEKRSMSNLIKSIVLNYLEKNKL